MQMNHPTAAPVTPSLLSTVPNYWPAPDRADGTFNGLGVDLNQIASADYRNQRLNSRELLTPACPPGQPGGRTY